MSETLLCGLIAGGVSILVAVIQNSSTRKLMEYQISELKTEVEKHNNIIARTYELEKRADVVEVKIRDANRRIDDLEKK